jgi:putative SOS response-associated peptidase YedK
MKIMCGRFALYSSLAAIKKLFRIDTIAGESGASYNIAPSQEVFAIIAHEGRRLGRLHWGLVPFRAQDVSAASKLINARVETLREKPGFKNLLRRRRCAIPADGFYEWRKIQNCKQPYFIASSSGSPFAFAGLWDTWKAHDGTAYHSCTIITTEAVPQVSLIHNRMPVILKPGSVDAWLDAELQDTGRLESILLEGHETAFTLRPVSGYVNSPKNNDEKCLAEEKPFPGRK